MTENRRTVERYMEGFRRSDHSEILSCLTDDVVWVMPDGFHLVGKAAFDGEIENPAFVGPPKIAETRWVEEGDIVVVEGEVLATRREGGILEGVFCDVFVLREALIAQLTSYFVVLK